MAKNQFTIGILLAVCCTARFNGPRRAVADGPAPAGLLGERFVDRSFGYSLRPFANANINQHKIGDPLGGFQLVEFVHRTRPWVLLVHLNRSDRSLRPVEYVDGLRAYRAAQYRGVETLARSERLIAARQAAVWNGRYHEASGSWALFEAAVQVNPTEFFRVILKAPTAEEATAAALFDVIIDSFEMLHSEVTAERLEAALVRGRALLRPNEPLDLPAVADPQATMIVRRGGQDLGFAEIREIAETRDGLPGLRIQERGWLFPAENVFHRIRNDFFVSNDLNTDLFEMRVQVYTPRTDDRPPVMAEQIERGVRDHDKLVLSYTEQLGDGTLVNDVLEVDGTYVPLGLLRILPRIVPLEQPELYAFSSYSGTRKGLVLRTFRVLGPPEPTDGVPPGTAFRVLDTEGITPPASEIHLDEDRRVRQIVAGEDTVIRSTRAQTELLFGARVEKASRELARLGLRVD